MSLPKKSKNFKVKTLVVILVLIIGIFLSFQYFLVQQLQNQFQDLINAKEDRSYDIRYQSIGFDLLNTQVTMEDITIVPINVDSTAPNAIRGEVGSARLNGFGIVEFLTNKVVSINELKFEEPKFTIVHSRREQTAKSSTSLQDLFKDVISRGEIKNFTLTGGEATIFLRNDTLRQIGHFEDFYVQATNLFTDTVRMNYAIPFQFDDLHTAFRNLEFEIKEGEILKLDHFDFDFQEQSLMLEGLSLSHDKDWTSVAREQDYQKDIIDFSIKTIDISRLSPLSTFYNSLVFISDHVLIDSLVLNDGRDKNIPRPPDEIKRNYTAIIKSIDVPIRIDTLEIINSRVKYSEINDGSRAVGSINLTDLNCSLFNLSSIDSVEMNAPYRMELTALINGAGKVQLRAIEDYNTLNVNGELSIGPMDMKALNPTLINMAGVEVMNGKLNSLRVQMKWDKEGSKNKFIIDYEDLDVEVLKKNSRNKDKFLTKLGRAAYHESHTKGDKHYKEPEYYSYRNLYRGPFNFLWLNIKDGVFQTVPKGLARKFVPTSKKKKK